VGNCSGSTIDLSLEGIRARFDRRLTQEPLDEVRSAYRNAIRSLECAKLEPTVEASKHLFRSIQIFESITDGVFDEFLSNFSDRERFCVFAMKEINKMLDRLESIERAYDQLIACSCDSHKSLCAEAIRAYEQHHRDVRKNHLKAITSDFFEDCAEKLFFAHFQPPPAIGRLFISLMALQQRCQSSVDETTRWTAGTSITTHNSDVNGGVLALILAAMMARRTSDRR
jgi:hypothetical protein